MTDNRFDDRMAWSLEMQQRHAIDIYNRYWDLDRVIEVDKAGDDGDETMQVLDYSGIDKILITETGHQIHIAQRFRQPYYTDQSGWTDADFSLRFKSYTDNHVEYQKLIDAYTGAGTIPSVYGFGRTVQGRQPAREKGFKEFYLIDLGAFIDNHIEGNIQIIDKKPNGDGSVGAYFDLSELRREGCILREYDFTRPKQPHDITAWGDD